MPQENANKGKVSLKVEDVMVREVVTISENASVKDAAGIMNKFEIGSIIAVRRGKAIGIVTERDLLKRVIAEGMDAKKARVKDIMSSPLVVIAPGAELEEALRLMFEKKIKKLVVVDQKRLVGLVSLTDMSSCEPAIIKLLKTFAAAQNTPKSMKKVLDYYII